MATRQAKGCTSQNSLLCFKTRKWPPECPWSSKQCSGSIANSVCIEAPRLYRLAMSALRITVNHGFFRWSRSEKFRPQGVASQEAESSAKAQCWDLQKFHAGAAMTPWPHDLSRLSPCLHTFCSRLFERWEDHLSRWFHIGFTLVSHWFHQAMFFPAVFSSSLFLPYVTSSCSFRISSIISFLLPSFTVDSLQFLLLIAIFYLLPSFTISLWSHLYVLNWHWYQWIPMIYTNDIYQWDQMLISCPVLGAHGSCTMHLQQAQTCSNLGRWSWNCGPDRSESEMKRLNLRFPEFPDFSRKRGSTERSLSYHNGSLRCRQLD
jgi:hypothetical protein